MCGVVVPVFEWRSRRRRRGANRCHGPPTRRGRRAPRLPHRRAATRCLVRTPHHHDAPASCSLLRNRNRCAAFMDARTPRFYSSGRARRPPSGRNGAIGPRQLRVVEVVRRARRDPVQRTAAAPAAQARACARAARPRPPVAVACSTACATRVQSIWTLPIASSPRAD